MTVRYQRDFEGVEKMSLMPNLRSGQTVGCGMESLTLSDLSPHLRSRAFRELVLFLVGWREDEQAHQRAADQVIHAYEHEPHLHMLGIEAGEHLLGLIGLEMVAHHHGVVRQIVVHPTARGKGIGRLLISKTIARFELRHLVAETDGEAVDFYRRCGFEVLSLGEKYPGVERFACTWRWDM